MSSRDGFLPPGVLPPDINGDSCLSNGLLIPLVYEALALRWVRALGYLALLLYLFLGIAIIADIFMCAIERITSRVKRIQRKTTSHTASSPNGSANGDLALHTGTMSSDAGGEEPEVIEVRVWNDTVANLTLMALGSSAPEILLSCIEIIGKG